jgi:hypothetical protein
MQNPKPAADAQVFSPVIGGRISVSIGEFAKLSGLGRTYLYGQIKSGRLKVHKHGRRTIIMAEAGLQFLEGNPATVDQPNGRHDVNVEHADRDHRASAAASAG